MALLLSHLEQINLSAKAIGELEFSQAKPFTNALLHNHEITALIRDTEPHERGLFSVDSGASTTLSQAQGASSRRRTAQTFPHSQTSAVARVLGNDMLRKIRSSNREGSRGGGVDVDMLLQGAEKLCAACDVPGAMDRIAALRQRHDQISASIKRFEDQVTRQQLSLKQLHAGGDEHNDPAEAAERSLCVAPAVPVTDADLRAEEEAVKELEAKKKALEASVTGMERDLGGLLR